MCYILHDYINPSDYGYYDTYTVPIYGDHKPNVTVTSTNARYEFVPQDKTTKQKDALKELITSDDISPEVRKKLLDILLMF